MKQNLFKALISNISSLSKRVEELDNECILIIKRLEEIETEEYADVIEYNAIIARVEEIKAEKFKIEEEFKELFA